MIAEIVCYGVTSDIWMIWFTEINLSRFALRTFLYSIFTCVFSLTCFSLKCHVASVNDVYNRSKDMLRSSVFFFFFAIHAFNEVLCNILCTWMIKLATFILWFPYVRCCYKCVGVSHRID